MFAAISREAARSFKRGASPRGPLYVSELFGAHFEEVPGTLPGECDDVILGPRHGEAWTAGHRHAVAGAVFGAVDWSSTAGGFIFTYHSLRRPIWMFAALFTAMRHWAERNDTLVQYMVGSEDWATFLFPRCSDDAYTATILAALLVYGRVSPAAVRARLADFEAPVPAPIRAVLDDGVSLAQYDAIVRYDRRDTRMVMAVAE